jgi:hypothetical protein
VPAITTPNPLAFLLRLHFILFKLAPVEVELDLSLQRQQPLDSLSAKEGYHGLIDRLGLGLGAGGGHRFLDQGVVQIQRRAHFNTSIVRINRTHSRGAVKKHLVWTHPVGKLFPL